MKLEDIFKEWDKDSEIDRTQINEELRKIPKLHNKYWKLLTQERLRLFQMQNEFKELKQEKFEFYTQGETAETKEKGWKLPARGVLLKAEAAPYIDSDKDVTALGLKIAMQNEKVDLLKSIIEEFKSRSWNLRGIIEFEKFRSGV